MDFMQILQICLCISYKVEFWQRDQFPPFRSIPSTRGVQQSCHGTTLWEANGAHGIHRSNTWQRGRDGVVVSLPPWSTWDSWMYPYQRTMGTLLGVHPIVPWNMKHFREKWHQQSLETLEVDSSWRFFFNIWNSVPVSKSPEPHHLGKCKG